MLAGGCMTPSVQPDAQERVPSPTSALAGDQADPRTKQERSSEGIRLQFTEARSAGEKTGAYAGCEASDWFELYNAGTESVDLGGLFVTNDPEKPDKHPLREPTKSPE